MINCLVVGIGGFIGSVMRYLIGRIPVEEGFVFPVKTLIINIVAAFIIGMIAAMAGRNPEFSPRVELFFKAGFCGGFSTLSALSLETVGLFTGGHQVMAVVYVIISMAACVGAVVLGAWLVNA